MLRATAQIEELLSDHGFALDGAPQDASGEGAGFLQFEHVRTGLLFVLLPPGRFRMGDDGPDADEDEKPVHEVSLTAPFLMARTPCTQNAWRRGAETTGLAHAVTDLASQARFPTFGTKPTQPIYHVTWLDCVRWCSVNGLELPTEAQWEYACRAGTDGPFSFGRGEEETLESRMWYSEHHSGGVPDVGTNPPNAWGLYDMHGTVWEWCQDVYDSAFYSRSANRDPCNVDGAGLRVHRGGAWDVPPICCRSSARYRDAESYCLGSIGFRPSLTLPALADAAT